MIATAEVTKRIAVVAIKQSRTVCACCSSQARRYAGRSSLREHRESQLRDRHKKAADSYNAIWRDLATARAICDVASVIATGSRTDDLWEDESLPNLIDRRPSTAAIGRRPGQRALRAGVWRVRRGDNERGQRYLSPKVQTSSVSGSE